MSKTALKVKIITWNMGDAKLTRDEWQKELIRSWEIISKRDFDILGICLQEDSTGSYGKFGETVADALADEYTWASNSAMGPPTIGRTGSFAVKAHLFIKKSKNIQYKVTKADTCLSRTVFCTKITVGISLQTPGFQFILMSAHLPVDSSRDDLGYAERVKAVNQSFSKVYDKLVGKMVDSGATQRISIFAGDFNFRDNTPITQRGTPVKDQLAYAMSDNSGDKSVFRGFSESDVTKFPPTYKLRTCVGNNCPACRQESDSKFDPTCYQYQQFKRTAPRLGAVFRGRNVSKNEVTEEPSHVDRILYRVDNLQAKLNSYKSWGKSEAVQHSSHNLVYADLDIIG